MPTATVQTITPEELKRILDSGQMIDLIDVRTPVEYRAVHITTARSLPLDTLTVEAVNAQRTGPSHEPLYIVCQSGGRSGKACAALSGSGIVAVSVEGGTPACEKAGIPVTRGQQNISLERQVRIGAGSLVVLGVALSALFSPWFLVIPGVVGCGLVFAGVTDFCGMGLMLAKMPWNK
jgi:rhodanese-related sulfurtransferase